MNNIGKPRYGLIKNGMIGFTIVSGVVTGIRYTEDLPLYEISFGRDKWWTPTISNLPEKLLVPLSLPTLKRIEETHNLKIKYNS